MATSTETGVNEKTKANNNNSKTSAFEKFLNLRDQAKQELKSSPFLLNVGMNGSDSGSDS